MNDYKIDISGSESEEIEKYLTESIMNYGIEQINGEKPKKAFCSIKDNTDSLVGGVMGYATKNLFFITHIYVDNKYRNKGYALNLLQAIEKRAKIFGCDLLRLNTLNKKTATLYIRAGFEETFHIENYMNGFDLVYYHKRI